MEQLTRLYAAEIATLEGAGWTDVHPTGTGGGCTALEARRGNRTLLATDGDHALVRGTDEESSGWLVTLYDEDDEEVGCGDDDTLTAALARIEPASNAFASGDVVQYVNKYGVTFIGEFIFEHRNSDGRLNGIARVRITDHERSWHKNGAMVDCGIVGLTKLDAKGN